jgi:hypothetical protein
MYDYGSRGSLKHILTAKLGNNSKDSKISLKNHNRKPSYPLKDSTNVITSINHQPKITYIRSKATTPLRYQSVNLMSEAKTIPKTSKKLQMTGTYISEHHNTAKNINKKRANLNTND